MDSRIYKSELSLRRRELSSGFYPNLYFSYLKLQIWPKFISVFFPILVSYFCSLTLSWRKSLSHRNQYTDLQSKSNDWFPYDRDHRHKRANLYECESIISRMNGYFQLLKSVNLRKHFNYTNYNQRRIERSRAGVGGFSGVGKSLLRTCRFYIRFCKR